MKNLNTHVFHCIFITYFTGTVSAAIVNKQKLEVCKRLGKNALYTFWKIFLNVVNGDYD